MLTAAHCAQTSGIEVILGDHDYDQTGETILGEKRFSVARAIVHEDYMNYGDDLALLELSEEADLNTFTPVCLPSFSQGNQSFTGNATVMGKSLPLVGKIDIIMVRLGLE